MGSFASTMLLTVSGTVTISTVAGIPVGTPYSVIVQYQVPGTPDLSGPNSSTQMGYLGAPGDSIHGSIGIYTISSSSFQNYGVLYDAQQGDTFGASAGSDANSTVPLVSPSISVQIVGPHGLLQSLELPTTIDTGLIQPVQGGFASQLLLQTRDNIIIAGVSSATLQVQTPETGSVFLFGLSTLVCLVARKRASDRKQ